MRILQVITDTDRRGAQVFALDLQGAMLRKGHQVETVALASGMQRPALDVEVLGTRPRAIATLRELRRRMASVDITIAHGSSTGLACALTGRPFVYRQISDSRFWADTWPKRLRVAGYLRRARSIVALSAGAKAALVEHLWIPDDRIHIVPNGVPVGVFHVPTLPERADARRALDLPIDSFVALYIGALVPEKGVDVAIRAVSRLPDVTLAIAGGGPEQARLQALANEVGGGRVHFLGVADQPMQTYAAADVVLLPSKGGDSMPATLIEAGFCGLPAIATPIGSIEDVVLHDRTGLIIPAGDESALAMAIQQLAQDRDERHRVGTAARDHCLAHFEIDVVAEGWLETLNEVTAGVASRDHRRPSAAPSTKATS